MPYKIAIHRADNRPTGPEAPSYLFLSMPPIHFDEITSCQIKISDFSSAIRVGHEPNYAITTFLITPPEAFFDEKMTISMEIWSLGCTYALRNCGRWASILDFRRQGLYHRYGTCSRSVAWAAVREMEAKGKVLHQGQKTGHGSNHPPSNLEYKLSRLKLWSTSRNFCIIEGGDC